MPRLHVVALSGRLPDWAEAACAEYARRMPKGYEVERVSVKSAKMSLPRNLRVVALDEKGKDLTTEQFARLLRQETAFVIGGPDEFVKGGWTVKRMEETRTGDKGEFVADAALVEEH